MRVPAPTGSPAATVASAAPATVLLVDDDPEYLARLERALGGGDDVEVRATASAAEALAQLDDVDCLVSAHRVDPATGIELLAAVRAREPTIPFLLHADDPTAAALEAVLDHEEGDYLPKGAGAESIELLRQRLRQLIERRRSTTLLGRTLAALEATRVGIAVVDAAGTVAFANRQYAAHVGASRESLVGSHWIEGFPAEAASRLESAAIPAADEGWRWTGACVLEGDDGPGSAQVSVVGLPDGGRVILVDAPGDGVRGDESTADESPRDGPTADDPGDDRSTEDRTR